MTVLFPRLTLFMVAACALTFSTRGDAVGSSPWRSLSSIESALGVTNFVWDGDSVCFSNTDHVVRFYQGRRKADVNGTTVWLNAQPDGSVANGNWRLSGVDLDLLQLAILPLKEGATKPLRVLIDPGHGGDDEGASCKNPVIKEKDLTLTLAKKIGARLKKAGLRVDYTRTRDTTLALDDRTRLADKTKADLFICVHANYAESAEACGVETYVLPPCGFPGTADGSRVRGWQIGNRNDFNSTLLGFSVHQKLAAQTNTVDRGLKRQSYFVLREASCPAVLIEFGFLSNRPEACKMLKSDWQERSTAAVAEGILAYARKVDPLDKAVAEKRSRDAEANERWRQHLAAQSAKSQAHDLAKLSGDTNLIASVTNRAAILASSPARAPVGKPAAAPAASNQTAAAATTAPAANAAAFPRLQPTAASYSNVVAASASAPVSTPTNAMPSEVHALLDFYGAGKVH